MAGLLATLALAANEPIGASPTEWSSTLASMLPLPEALLPEGSGIHSAGAQEKLLRGGHGLRDAKTPHCEYALAKTRAHCEAYRPVCNNATWQMYMSPSAKVAYLKTAKAASVSIEDYMYTNLHPIVKVGGTADQLPNGTFTFTFVRDPLDRALAGYAEVDGVHRHTASEGKPWIERRQAKAVGCRYTRIDRATAGGEARFLAYLDDLIHNRLPLEWKAGHSMPVADHLRSAQGLGQLHFVGKIEDLKRDWPAWQQMAEQHCEKIRLPPACTNCPMPSLRFAPRSGGSAGDEAHCHAARGSRRQVSGVYRGGGCPTHGPGAQ